MPANWYRDGTATAAQGSKTVVGAGTLWSTQARAGDLFGFLSNHGITKLYEIESVVDNTHLSLVFTFGDTNVTAGEYAIIRNFNTTMTSETNATLVSFVREWKLALQQNLKGDPGETGDNGLSFRMGSGAPSVALGDDGDGYLDFAAWNIYRREAGAWVVRGNIKGTKGDAGASGSKLYVSTSNPSSGVGIVGDVAINTTSGDVFSRTSIGWTLAGNIKGPKGEPGDKGDSVKGDPGDQGIAGSKWHWGSGTPSPTLGVESDNYLNTATGDCYQNTSGTWVYKSNLKGPRGLPGDVGPIGVTWRGAYSAETAYIANDGVSNAGCSYIALQASTGQTPPTPTAGANEYWGFLSLKGADGEGSGDMMQEVYDPNKDGKVLTAELADRALNAEAAARATNADHADSVEWGGVSGKPPSFTPSPHALSAHESSTLEELNALLSGEKAASTAVATTSAAGLMSATDKTKLEGVATGANNYTHPSTHAPSVIAQDASNRFVTDTEKATWNGKAAGTHAHTMSDISDLDTWIPITGWTRTDDSTVTYGVALSTLASLRYRVGTGAWRYGLVVARSGSTHTIAGEPLISTVTEIQVDWTGLKTTMLYFYAPGAFAPTANLPVVLSDQRGGTTWLETPIFPRFMRTRCKTAYGGTAPCVNMKINGSFIFGDNSGLGLDVVASSWSATGTSITNAGSVYYSDAGTGALVGQITRAGSGTAGSDMWIEVACVKI